MTLTLVLHTAADRRPYADQIPLIARQEKLRDLSEGLSCSGGDATDDGTGDQDCETCPLITRPGVPYFEKVVSAFLSGSVSSNIHSSNIR